MLKPAAGPCFFAVIALLLFAGAYAMWPGDFLSTPFPDLTTGMLLRAVASLVLGIIGLEFLAALAIAALSDLQ